MYAIIEACGRQYTVKEGDVVFFENLNKEVNDKVDFDKVVYVSTDSDNKVGTPYVEGANVSGKVLENGKAKKIMIFKYKAKKGYRRRQGHRQPFTKVVIETIKA